MEIILYTNHRIKSLQFQVIWIVTFEKRSGSVVEC